MKQCIAVVFGFILLAGCASTPPPSDNEKIIEQLSNLGLESREIDRGVLIVLPDIYFEFDKHDLTLDARKKLQDAAVILNGPLAIDREVAIEGHTDAIGTEQYNMELSLKRAGTVNQELFFSNMSEDRMSVEGFGESRPIAPNTNADGSDNPEGRAANRRVEIVLLNL